LYQSEGSQRPPGIPERNAHQAIAAFTNHVKQGFSAVYDAALSPHPHKIAHVIIFFLVL